jgi:hypothetical protein
MGAKKLIEFLREKEKGDKLYHKLEEIKAKAEQLLAKITEIFPEYTIHDMKHSEKVLEKLEEVLITDVLKGKMNVYEIFFLMASAYLHDIGMVDFPELIEKHKEEFEEFITREKLKESEISDEEAKKRFIREHHHLRSEEYIIEHYKAFGIEDEHQARIIGKICRGHRKEDLSNKEFDSERMYNTEGINEPLLSAFLRIGDELDLDFERAPLIIYEAFKPKDIISQEEWEKNLSVSGVARSKEDPSLIKVSATCKSSRVHRALKMFEVKVQDELLKLRDYLHNYKEFQKELPVRIVVDISPEGYEPCDIKFSLREREIAQLLMGETLYGSKDACIRELLQNDVDACRMRRKLLMRKGLDYKPEVIFELTSDGKVIVTDNGTGMDEYIAKNYFAQLGRCFYTSPDFSSQEFGFTPVSRYGIGILSCFMLADKLESDTKTEEGEPLFIEIDNMFNYFFVKEGKRRNVGTTVTLFLTEEVRKEVEERKFNLEKVVGAYARHLEFPIKIISPDGKCVMLKDKGYTVDLGEWYFKGCYFYDGKNLDLQSNFTCAWNEAETTFQKAYYEIPLDERDVKGVIGLSLTNLADWTYSPYSVVVISDGGICICNDRYLLPGAHRGYTLSEIKLPLIKGLFIDLNIESGILDLNISRSGIIENKKYHEFRSRLEDWIIKGVDEFIENFSGTETPLGAFDFNLFLEAYVRKKDTCPWPDSFINLARKYYKFQVFTKEGVHNMSYGEIVKNRREVNFIEIPKEIIKIPYFKKYLEEIINNCSGFKQGKFYLIYNRERGVMLFDNDFSKKLSKRLVEFFKIEEQTDLKGIIPSGIKLVKFKNYKVKRFIEENFSFARYYRGEELYWGEELYLEPFLDREWYLNRELYLNEEHKFSELLINKKKAILKDIDIKKDVREFFSYILIFGRNILFYRSIISSREILETITFKDILDKQRQILRLIMDKGLMDDDVMKNYELIKEDFPPMWFI